MSLLVEKKNQQLRSKNSQVAKEHSERSNKISYQFVRISNGFMVEGREKNRTCLDDKKNERRLME